MLAKDSNQTLALKCPYTCLVADSVMKNILTDNITQRQTSEELHAECGVTNLLITKCWNEERYGKTCIPRSGRLRESILKFNQTVCKEHKGDWELWSRQTCL